ncbi:hypothetical protein [Nostoc sp. C110]
MDELQALLDSWFTAADIAPFLHIGKCDRFSLVLVHQLCYQLN